MQPGDAAGYLGGEDERSTPRFANPVEFLRRSEQRAAPLVTIRDRGRQFRKRRSILDCQRRGSPGRRKGSGGLAPGADGAARGSRGAAADVAGGAWRVSDLDETSPRLERANTVAGFKALHDDAAALAKEAATARILVARRLHGRAACLHAERRHPDAGWGRARAGRRRSSLGAPRCHGRGAVRRGGGSGRIVGPEPGGRSPVFSTCCTKTGRRFSKQNFDFRLAPRPSRFSDQIYCWCEPGALQPRGCRRRGS